MKLRIVLLLCTALVFGCGKSPQHEALASGARVLAFGDSVTYGTGAATGEDYPGRLAALTGWNIVNAGVPGDTAAAAKSRIASALEDSQPVLVIIELGGNDFLRRRPESQVKEDLRQIIATVREAKGQPVLIAVPAVSLFGAAAGMLSDAGLYAELGKEEKLPVVDKLMSGILSRPELRSDQIHPNAEGYRQFADGIARALEKEGFLLKH